MNTLTRWNKYKLPKLEEELSLHEGKLIWKWDKKKIPKSLSDILTEKDDNLRNRRFNINRKWKTGSLALRLAKRAYKSMKVMRSKKSLSTKLK